MKEPKRKQIRLKGYDYSQNGCYFVTICTQNRQCIFGDIVNNKMVLNDIGKMIKNNWESLPKRFPIELDEYQIMPNHLHSIIAIVGAGSSRPNNDAGSSRPTLGQIIAYFKYQSTKQINNIFQSNKMYGRGIPAQSQTGAKTAPLQKIFQRNYYEHVIRNEIDSNKIREYIKLNPEMWERDRNNPNHI